jgi:hypothetical protein
MKARLPEPISLRSLHCLLRRLQEMEQVAVNLGQIFDNGDPPNWAAQNLQDIEGHVNDVIAEISQTTSQLSNSAITINRATLRKGAAAPVLGNAEAQASADQGRNVRHSRRS